MILKNKLDLLNVEIKGEEVMLRPISMDDADNIFREFTPEISRYMMPAPPDKIEQIYLFIELSHKGMNKQEDLVLTIRRISDGEFLGVWPAW